jgi:cytochrome c oxidase assembly factor CtaG
MKSRIPILAALAPLAATPAWAHGTPVLPDARWWTQWNFDPVIVINLLALGAAYAFGLRRLRAQRAERTLVRGRHVAAFAVATGFLAVALLSPVARFAGELLWIHMVQHMVLMNVAAPLFVLGAPGRVLPWALNPADRAWVGRVKLALTRRGVPRYLLWQPVTLAALYATVLWVWHLPRFYEAALRSQVVHDLQHLMFFAVSALFWRVLFDPIGRLCMARAPAVIYLFLTSLHATILGVFMALAPRLWYPTYAGRTEPWGVSALEDQQLAGYIMWMPACMVYAVIAAVLFAGWLREEDETGESGAATLP